MKKPCNGCREATSCYVNGKQRWFPYRSMACEDCPKLMKYQEYLKSRQKYERGKPITSIHDFICWFENNEFVYLGHKILHKGFVFSWQLQMILNSINAGVFYEANLKQ